ncbi:nucleotidyltransferase domain-containing protein [Candidatus Woesearchaeota archaeon]|nr:nucleotidyltransferase domain-containing protein [Candidatus Woesearchaeota archaeon]
MDIYKLKFTVLQMEILRFLFIKSGMAFNERGIARHLDVSPTAVSNSLEKLEKENMISVKKDKESKRLSIGLNKDNPKVYSLKRAENLKLIDESGLAEFLSDAFPGSSIILFGSYSTGEDNVNSDIDIAIIGSKEKELDTSKFHKLLERPISLNFYEDFRNIKKNLKDNICNGIVLKGAIQL